MRFNPTGKSRVISIYKVSFNSLNGFPIFTLVKQYKNSSAKRLITTYIAKWSVFLLEFFFHDKIPINRSSELFFRPFFKTPR